MSVLGAQGMLTSLIGEGARQVASARTRRQADKVTDAVIEYARRLMTGGPWTPPAKPAGDAGPRSRPAGRRPGA